MFLAALAGTQGRGSPSLQLQPCAELPGRGIDPLVGNDPWAPTAPCEDKGKSKDLGKGKGKGTHMGSACNVQGKSKGSSSVMTSPVEQVLLGPGQVGYVDQEVSKKSKGKDQGKGKEKSLGKHEDKCIAPPDPPQQQHVAKDFAESLGAEAMEVKSAEGKSDLCDGSGSEEVSTSGDDEASDSEHVIHDTECVVVSACPLGAMVSTRREGTCTVRPCGSRVLDSSGKRILEFCSVPCCERYRSSKKLVKEPEAG